MKKDDLFILILVLALAIGLALSIDKNKKNSKQKQDLDKNNKDLQKENEELLMKLFLKELDVKIDNSNNYIHLAINLLKKLLFVKIK